MPGACAPVARKADSSGSRLLRLTHLEVEGFKSFRDRAVIGPLADFTCVVGPNGCGKSVVGEAVAFALGGNRKMLRTGNLAGLLNQELAAAGHKTAEVILHMEIIQGQHPAHTRPHSSAAASTQTPLTAHKPQHTPSQPNSSAVDPMSPDHSHASLGQQQQHTATQQQHHTQQGEAGKQQQEHAEPQQQLKLKRMLRGGASKGYIMRPGSASWSPVSQAELQAELAPYGIDTLVVDRYIVTQSRQAVDVSDAVGLVKQLEALTGAVDYEAAIAQHSTGLEQLAASLEETKSQIDRLIDEREVLAPAVAHWQEVQLLEAAVAASKLQLLSDQQEHGTRLLKAQALQVQSAQDAAAAATDALESAEGNKSQLLLQRSALEKELVASKRREEQLVKKVSQVTAAAAAAEVQHASATSALKDNKSLLKALQKKLAQHGRQEGQHKTQVEEGTAQLRVLQDVAAAAQERLAAARQAAAAEAAKQGASRAGSSAGAATEDSSVLLRLQQQAKDTQQQLHVLTARQTTAAAKATRAAKSVETLQQKADAAAAAAAEADQVLAAAQNNAQAAAAAVAASRHRSRAAEDKWRAAEVQQQSILNQLEGAEQQQGGQQHNSNNSSSTPGAWPSYDTAVQHLAAASASRQLPGQFHGRLCNVMSVADASLQPAVNAALQERCNLASTLIVSDRATAAAVIEHFRQNKVGTVNCKILSELQQQRTGNELTGAAAAAAGCTPLLQLLQYNRQAVQGLQPLLEQLLGDWLLVESREVAMGLLYLRRSMVTRSGEVFKADGEIVATIQGGASSSSGGRDSKLPAYSLPVGQPVPIAAPTRDSTRPSHQDGSTAANRAGAGAVRRLKQQLAAAQNQASSAEQELEAANLALLQHEQQQAAADSKLKRLQQQQQQAMRVHASSADQLKHQLRAALQQQEAADSELAAAEGALVNAQQQQEQLQHQLAASAGTHGAGGRKAAAGRRGKPGAAAEASTAAAEQQTAEQAATEAEAAVEEAWREVHKAEQQQKRAASRAAATNKEVAKAQAAMAASDVGMLQAKLEGYQQQLSDMHADLQQVRSEAAGISSKLKPLRQHLVKAAATKDEASAALEQAQDTLLHTQADLHSLQQQQEHRAQQLQQLQDKHASAAAAPHTTNAAATGVGACKKARTMSSSQELADTSTQQQQQGQGAVQDTHCAAAAAAAVADLDMVHAADQGSNPQKTASQGRKHSSKRAGSSQGGRRAGLRRSTCVTVIPDSSSSSSSASDADDECSSSSSSGGDSDAPASRKRRSSAAAAGPRRGGARASHESHNSDTLPSAAALVKRTAELQRQQQQLDEQQQELQQEYNAVDRAALERDLAALQTLAAATATLQHQQAQHEGAATAFEQLLDERYSRLLSVLQSLNARLDAVYSQLTGGCGKAYCSYTAERRLLFSQGVTLQVQPDGRTWRKLGMLSGGQRSLATLALSFALQTLFPSPFYFFDEVDCALDTSAAARVAAYVRQQCSGPSAAQFLLVSHKPVVFESAGCLLGVYSNGRGSSAAVVGHFV